MILILFSIFSIPAKAATFTVTNLNDSGVGSLRQAILDANAASGTANTIVFQPGLSGNLLTVGNLRISGRLTLSGPGAGVLTLFGNGTTIFVVESSATVTLSGLKISNGYNAIENRGVLAVTSCILSANQGGIWTHGSSAVLTLNYSVVSDNAIRGILNESGTLTVNSSTVSGNGNTASGASYGGGIGNTYGGTVTVNRSTLSGNKASSEGGAIYSNATLAVNDSTVSGNSTISYAGGGIYSRGLMFTVRRSTLSGNSAGTSCGGGIYVREATSIVFHSNTLSGNTAEWGGGLCVDDLIFKMVNNTLSGNTASSEGGGIYIYSGSILNTGNNVVAGNTAPTAKEIVNYGTFVSDGYNLFGESGNSGLVNATPVVGDKILAGLIGSAIGPLANNGGPTLTRLPVAGSPALNAGKNALIPTGVITDQRGYGPRIVGPAVDIGAVEVGAVAAYPVTVNKTGGNGTVTSAPAGINCGTTCTKSFAFGSTVTLTATPAAGYGFTGWLGACTGTTCKLTMTAAKSVTALFNNAAATYTLTVAKAGNGAGTVTSNPAGIACGADCTQPYSQGTSVTLTATPAAGSKFAGWSGACAGTGACAISMTAAKNVTATFTRPVLTVGKVGSGLVATAGSSSGIFCGTDCTETYNLNAAVNLVAIPGVGRRFVGWTGCTSNASFPQLCTVTMSQSKAVAATFQ